MADEDGEADWRQKFFRPRRIALIGASDRSAFSVMAHRRFAAYGHRGAVYGVNIKGQPAHGAPTYTSCRDTPEPCDLAFVVVNANAVEAAFKDAASAGIRNAVVLSSGFAEAGLEGRALQDRLVAAADALGVRFMGPNSLGFANMAAQLVATSIPVRQPLNIGGVGIVSQSGALLADMARFAHQQNVGLSFVCAPGNAAMIGVLDAVEYMIGDPATRVILAYIESGLDGARFRAAAVAALAAGKPMVVLKAGSGELAAAVARAHTGAVLGNDKIFDAVCRQYGVIRCQSVEEMMTAAALLDGMAPLAPGRGVAVASVSGGGCVLYAEAAEREGLPVPALAPATEAALAAALPPFATPANPLDVTGVVFGKEEILAASVAALAADPAIGLVATLLAVPPDESETVVLRRSWEVLGPAYEAVGLPPLVINQVMQPVSAFTQRFMAETGCTKVICGLDLAVRALAHLHRWSLAMARGVPVAEPAPAIAAPASLPHGERAVLAHLAAHGVAVVPQRLVTSAEAAVLAAAAGLPVALKIASPDIAHKTEIGGVRLGLATASDVAAAYAGIMADAARHAPDAVIEGVLVAPMRPPATELFVGIARDAEWGLVLALGLGGIWIEVLQDVAVRPLPVAPDDVIEMLSELRGAAILRGVRGTVPADLRKLAATVTAIAAAAQALGPSLASLEVNPLRVDGSEIEALDALAIYG